MQNLLSCYLNLVYLNMQWIVEVPSSIQVKQFIHLLKTQFKCEVEGCYLLEMKTNRILDGEKTLMENEVQSGDYLYFI